MKKWSKRKWLEDPLNFVEIKNPFGSLQTNPQADAWWVRIFFVFEKKCLLVHPNIQSLSVSTVSTVSTSFRVDFGTFFRFFRVLWLHIYSSWIQIQMEQYNGGISNRVFLLTWKSGILTQDARLKVTSQVDRGTWLGYIPTQFIAIQHWAQVREDRQMGQVLPAFFFSIQSWKVKMDAL